MASNTRTTRPSFTVNQEGLSEVIRRRTEGDIVIPDHQRGFVWGIVRQQELVETVLSGMPIPTIIIQQPVREPGTLEDGHQRLQTMERYINNDFPTKDGRFFRDLSIEERMYISNYPIPILTYRNASKEQVITIFYRFQNGFPLTVGERLHSLSSLSPLVKFTKMVIMTPGSGLHDRAAAVWGARGTAEDPRRRVFLNACAMVAGLAFGSSYFSRKQADFERREGDGPMAIAREFDTDVVLAKLRQILAIYEKTDARHHLGGKRQMNLQWDLGKLTGYIAHSLNVIESERWHMLESRWVDFLVETRQTPPRLTGLHDYVNNDTRKWLESRWKSGCHYVMPDLFENPNPDSSNDEDEDDSDED